MTTPLQAITRLKEELDALRPLPPDVLAQVEQKLRLEANYNSNAIEGNTLTYGETRNLILHGLTAHGKPMRDHLDIEGHDEAVKAIEVAVNDNRQLTEAFIRNLHRTLLKEPYDMNAVTPDGNPAKKTISVGEYKVTPNKVITSTGETLFYPVFPILGVFRLNRQSKRDSGSIVRSCKAIQSPVYPIRDAILAVNHASCPSLSSSGPPPIGWKRIEDKPTPWSALPLGKIVVLPSLSLAPAITG